MSADKGMCPSAVKQIFLAVLLFHLPFLKPTLAENQLCDNKPHGSLWRPSRLFDQHFGLALDDDDLFFPRWLRSYAGYLRPWRTEASQADSGSSVHYDKDKFEASLDVQQFKPDEITVKLTDDNTITVEGKHEEKQDEHGYISRHFVRRYTLPDSFDKNRIQSKLSSDGVLTISAPTVAAKQIDHREIPIQQTGEPAKRLQQAETQEQSGEKKAGGSSNEL